MTIQPWVKSYPPNVRWDAPLELSSVQSVLENAAETIRPEPALDFMNKRTTYAELDALANRAAAGFQKLGVGPGVHVGLYLPNTPHYVIAFFGVLKAGGVVVNYSPLDALPTLAIKVEDSETDILVTLDVASLYPQAEKLLASTRLKTLVVGEFAEMTPAPEPVKAQMTAGGHAGRGQARRAPCRVPRSHRQRRPLSGPSARRAHRRAGRHSIYRRHDRLAQGRDADARQSDRGLLALYGGDDPQRTRACAWARSGSSASCRCSTSIR